MTTARANAPTMATTMTVEATLTREQFIKLSLLRHLFRMSFYFYSFTCSLVTAYAIYTDRYLFLLIVWPPFLLYLLIGAADIIRTGLKQDQPFFLPTRYEFTSKGVAIRTSQGQSHLMWDQIASLKVMAGCYVLTLQGGTVLAIPLSAFPNGQGKLFETLVQNYLERR
ncbi:MAG: YcxB family protein [Chloroflexaceae bacterium]|nr:YcxB family protein [Chloroflexaceae bacterium]